MRHNLNIVLVLLFMPFLSFGQAYITQVFKDTRVINTHSTEVLEKGHMDIRIGHRFGDILGDRGGWETFYGLEQARDVFIGAEYGITDNAMVGISRTKGAGDLRQNINGLVKLRFLRQDDDKAPISVALLGVGSVSTMPKNEEGTSVTTFPEFHHRMVFHTGFLLSKKFGSLASVQLGAGFTHRNLVLEGGDNDIINLSLASRIQITKSFGFIFDANFPFAETITTDLGYYPAIGVGFEFETGGGHVFQINVTNASGLLVTDYIPYTRSNWSKGEIRLGFTISRRFKI